jgi:hypothetical protein
MSPVIARLPAVLATLLLVAQLDTVPVCAASPPTTSCQVFPSDDIWNTDISTLPVHAQSAAWLSSMASATTRLHPTSEGRPMDFVQRRRQHPPKGVGDVPLRERKRPRPVSLGADTRIENGTDHHAVIINRDTCTLYELSNPAGSGTSWTADSGVIFPLNYASF